jgi:hypothetical protein
MLSEEKFEELAALNPEALLVDGLNEAVIGFGHQFSNAPVAIYDYDKCIEIYMRDNGWDYDEAMEWMSFNVIGAWMGEGTPIFMTKFEEEQ